MSNNLLAGATGGASEIKNPVLGGLGDNASGLSFFQTFIPNLITLAFVVGVVIFFFMLIIGAIQWISSGGDKQSLENARGKITSAIIGLVIMFSVFAIVKLIEGFIGVSILTLDIGNLIIR